MGRIGLMATENVIESMDDIASCPHCHGEPDLYECVICGARDCPANEPLHYHHDGCPVCSLQLYERRK
jgi:hypothetical protein